MSAAFAGFAPAPDDVVDAVGLDVPVVAPADLDEAARVLDEASERRARVLVWGGGTHQGIGYRVEPDVVLATARMSRILAWEPDDLTLVVEAGARVADVETMLAGGGQTAVLPEHPAGATVGGVVASGSSGYRRARYGPVRNNLLEVTLVCGDGRIVRGGGRVVKNVSGYDLPRFSAGSFGALGLIGTVCCKLWPVPEASATVVLDDPAAAGALYRPLAVLETPGGVLAFVQGTPQDVEAQTRRLDGEARAGLDWPPDPAGDVHIAVRVPPALTGEARRRLPAGWDFVAQHGVGVVTAAGPETDLDEIRPVRGWAEAAGGSLVLLGAPDGVYARLDPWGAPPTTMPLQRRLVAAFDPLRVVNPGRLPGGL